MSVVASSVSLYVYHPIFHLCNFQELGYLDKMYVYGFDEMKQSDNQSVYDIFGAIKKTFPDVKTMVRVREGK